MIFKAIYIKPILLFLLFIAGLTGLADYTVNSVSYKWDRKTEEHLDQLLINAGTAYGVSRGLNSVISVIQKSDINIVIGNLALGEALDPVNDIVERFSNVMLISITSLGIQKFIYHTGKLLGVNLFLTLAILFFLTAALFQCFPNIRGDKVIAITKTLGTTFLILCFLIRFIIPSIVLISLHTTSLFEGDIDSRLEKLEEIKSRSQFEFNQVSTEMDNSTEKENNDEKKGFFSRIADSVTNAGTRFAETFSTVKIKENINRAINSLKESIEYIIELIVIFIIQTIAIPIFTFFLIKSAFLPLIQMFFSGLSKTYRKKSYEI